MRHASEALRKTWQKCPAVWIVLIGLLFMLPILVAAGFTHPWWDDYVYTNPVREAFLKEQSLLAAVRSAAEVSYDKYLNWSGAFAHQFLAGLEPQFITYYGYKAGMVLSGLWFVFSVYFLAFTAGGRLLKLPRYVSALAGTLVLVLTSYLMPTPHEFFFWLTGACNYTYVVSFLSCAAALLIRAFFQRRAWLRTVEVVLACLLAFFVGGSNHSTALFAAAALGVGLFLLLLRRETRRTAATTVLPAFFFSALGLLLNVLAPGNSVRMDGLTQTSPPLAILYSLTNMLWKILEWSAGLPLIAAVLVFPLFLRSAAKTRFSFRYPFAVLLLSFCVLASQYTPSLYAQSDLGPGRVSDCVYYFYLWWLFANLFYFSGWISRKFALYELCPKRKLVYFGAAIVLSIAVIRPAMLQNANGIVCVRQFVSGEIQTYDREMSEIHRALESTPGDTVVVQDLTVYPIVRAGSFSSNPNSIINKTAAEYHGKKALIVEANSSES